MARICGPDIHTCERLADAKAAEKCLTPCWPLKKAALWTVKNSVFKWSRRAGRGETGGDTLSTLPLQIRQDLLDAMLKLKPDGREVMAAAKNLLKGGIYSFDLGCLDECHHYDVRQVVKLLTESGHIVRRIAIRGQWLFDTDNRELLTELLRSLVNVEDLCLQETSTNAPELNIILRNCAQLRRTEIVYPSLTDEEVLTLIGIPSNTSKIHTIKVPSSLTGPGLMTLLQVFPNLMNIDCSHLDHLLDCLDSSLDVSWWNERMLGLRSVRTSHPISRDTLARLVSRCPNLTSVSIEIQEHVDLHPLSKLQNLIFLELRNSAVLPVSYENKVLNLVNLVGPRLLHLSLEHFETIDLTQVSSFCRKLESLELRWFTTLTVSRVPKGLNPFSCLTSLCVRPRTNQHVKGNACELLLSKSVMLQKLEMYCCHGLDDALLARLLKSNPMQHLRVLLLRHGHGVTGAGLRQLVGKSSRIELWDFGTLTSDK